MLKILALLAVVLSAVNLQQVIPIYEISPPTCLRPNWKPTYFTIQPWPQDLVRKYQFGTKFLTSERVFSSNSCGTRALFTIENGNLRLSNQTVVEPQPCLNGTIQNSCTLFSKTLEGINRFSLAKDGHNLLFANPELGNTKKAADFCVTGQGCDEGVLKALADPDLIDQDDCWLVVLLMKAIWPPGEGDHDEM
jgi:hypothetical protein